MGKVYKRPNILEVLQDYSLECRQVGNNYFTFCLWHNDGKTPNLCIYPETNSFFCFTCHKYGSVENLIAKLENKSYYDVIKMLYGDNYEFRKLGEDIPTINPDSKYMVEVLSKEIKNSFRKGSLSIDKIPSLINRIINIHMDMNTYKGLLKEIRDGKH